MTDCVITSKVINTSGDAQDLSEGDTLHLAPNVLMMGEPFGIRALKSRRKRDHPRDTLLIIDANGVAGYQAAQNYAIELVSAVHLASLSTGDFG